jgi:CMP/dCMP kinase
MSTVIAIDGPAASGKSSVARLLAQKIGFAYVNSGNFYRTATWWLLREGVDLSKTSAVEEAIARATITAGFENGEAFFRLNGEDGLSFLHGDEVNRGVSHAARVSAVRDAVTGNLRLLGQQHDVVVEGRDIGSVVFPDTPFKFYIDASPEIRQQRRAAQGQQDQVTERDRIDSSRANAPLTIAPDAVVLDSTHFSISEVMEQAFERLKLPQSPASTP